MAEFADDPNPRANPSANPQTNTPQLIGGLRPERRPLRLPLAGATVAAGFPSPADDYIEVGLDLNELLIRHPSSTFFLRVSGDSMVGAGIQHGDLLVVDRSLGQRGIRFRLAQAIHQVR